MARRSRLAGRAGVAASPGDDAGWRSRFDALFEGDFDNYDQIAAERRVGVVASDSAGHEQLIR